MYQVHRSHLFTCGYQSNRYRLVSLLEMLQISAEEWNSIVRELDRLGSTLLNFRDTTAALMDGDKAKLAVPLERIMSGCVALELRFSAQYVDRLIARVNGAAPLVAAIVSDVSGDSEPLPRMTMDEFTRAMSILRDRINDELELRQFLAVEPSKSRYYNSRHLFGEDVSCRFPSANDDIVEAGNCFTLDRHTACVFHLMRVMEVTLRALSKSLNDSGIDAHSNPSWDSILKRFRKELEKARSERSAEWKQADEFYSGVADRLMAVKDAWRNPTMHVERNYTEEQAKGLMNAVEGFMRHLATQLHE